jgi:hypothetical protein
MGRWLQGWPIKSNSLLLLPNVSPLRPMPTDLIPFLAGISLLILYLLWSAATEMGTKPWRK